MLICFGCYIGALETSQFCVMLATSYITAQLMLPLSTATATLSTGGNFKRKACQLIY